jgi:hypothetical protein
MNLMKLIIITSKYIAQEINVKHTKVSINKISVILKMLLTVFFYCKFLLFKQCIIRKSLLICTVLHYKELNYDTYYTLSQQQCFDFILLLLI